MCSVPLVAARLVRDERGAGLIRVHTHEPRPSRENGLQVVRPGRSRRAIAKQGTASGRSRPALERVRTLRSCEPWPTLPPRSRPGVHRLGNAIVNCYLIEDGNRMTLVDGGFPGFRAQLDELPALARTNVSAIAAVILTHAHSDHVGMSEGVRRDARALRCTCTRPTRRWPAPARSHKREGSLLPYLWRPAIWRAARDRCSRSARRARRRSREVTTFTDGDLDVPGPPAGDPHARPLPRPRRVPPARPRGADRGRRAVLLQPADAAPAAPS